MHDASAPPADCFYVYPTVSTEKTDNSDLVVQSAEISVAISQASPFSEVCRAWAPMYRQVTLADLAGSNTTQLPGSSIHIDLGAESVAYASLLSAWKDYLKSDNDGRPFVLIGHSQGAAMLIWLLMRQVDAVPSLRARMLSAILLGGNVQVPVGQLVGATFRNIPGCASPTQTGCVIAYSSFDRAPPPASLFGRPGQGISLQEGQTTSTGMQVLCTNPAALGGGSAALDDSFYARGAAVMGQVIATPWVSFPGRYRATCENSDGATWLQVTPTPGDPRPRVRESLGPNWGLHADDMNLAIGNLVQDVATEEVAFRR